MEFKDLKIDDDLIKDLYDHGIVKPTIVQEKTIPLIMRGKDVMVQSETGSGKTIGFAIPTIEKIKSTGKAKVLVIAPTRELAKQIGEEYVKFSKKKRLKVAIVYGGVSINPQITKLRDADVVVGTPGRLLDLINRMALDLRQAEFLVIDEADRLLDMGFIDDMNRIIGYMPKNRQTLMFSATINSRVLKLMHRYQKSPEKILLENVIEKSIMNQYYYNIKEREKISFLIHIMKTQKHGLTLVFCNTKRKTRFVASILKKNGLKAESLNGDMTQHMREKAMRDFALGNIEILVATDVAARGIHVEDITHVINFDLHDELETYTHRVGRTARQGKKGTAIIFLSEKDYYKMDKIMEEYRDLIEKREPGEFTKIKMPPRRDGGRRFNNRQPRHSSRRRRR
jgi:ATP-dependent RNA helicase DeaD